MVARVRRIMPWLAGLLVMLIAVPGGTQGNIDAGKTPAQIFSDTCSACHRRPSEVRRASAGFLRQHYTTGAAEASAMATYLASVAPEPKSDPKKDRAKIQQDKVKAQQDKGKTQAQAQQEKATAKTRRAETSKAETVADTKPDSAPQQETPAVPVLEPFEE